MCDTDYSTICGTDTDLRKPCCTPKPHPCESINNASPLDQCKVVPVIEEINRAVELKKKKARNQLCEEYDYIKPLYADKKKKKCCPPLRVLKIRYPPPDKFKGCKHADNMIMDRDIMTKKEHINMLATPKPIRFLKPKCPYYVIKDIQCATIRLAELAQPKKYKVLETWEQYCDQLDPYHIDNFRSVLHRLNYTTTDQAVEFFVQQKKDEKLKKRKRAQLIRKMRRKIVKQKIGDCKCIMEKIFDVMKTYFMQRKSYHLTPEQCHMSKVILKMICEFIGHRIPNRKSKDTFECFLVSLADKITVWMSSFIKSSGYIPLQVQCSYDDEASCIEPPVVCPPPDLCPEMYPIDDYIELTPSHSSGEDDEGGDGDEYGYSDLSEYADDYFDFSKGAALATTEADGDDDAGDDKTDAEAPADDEPDAGADADDMDAGADNMDDDTAMGQDAMSSIDPNLLKFDDDSDNFGTLGTNLSTSMHLRGSIFEKFHRNV